VHSPYIQRSHDPMASNAYSPQNLRMHHSCCSHIFFSSEIPIDNFLANFKLYLIGLVLGSINKP
jgi:hypothetical protein